VFEQIFIMRDSNVADNFYSVISKFGWEEKEVGGFMDRKGGKKRKKFSKNLSRKFF